MVRAQSYRIEQHLLMCIYKSKRFKTNIYSWCKNDTKEKEKFIVIGNATGGDVSAEANIDNLQKKKFVKNLSFELEKKIFLVWFGLVLISTERVRIFLISLLDCEVDTWCNATCEKIVDT